MSLFDKFSYRNKRVLVVGGATGMGAAAAELVRDAGAEVVVMDRGEIKLQGVRTLFVDLSEKQSIDQALVECGGKIDALFSCAGVADGTPGIERINFIGHRYMIDQLFAADMFNDGAAIGMISSAAGMGWEPNLPELIGFLAIDDFDKATQWAVDNGKCNYMFTKQAVCAYVARMAMPFLKKGVRINAILPGPTDTPLARDNADSWLTFGKDYRAEAGVEVSTPAEQAGPLVYLCSDAAAVVSGITLITDVGFTSSAVSDVFPSAKMIVNFLRGVGGGAAGGSGAAPQLQRAATTEEDKPKLPEINPETRMLINGELVAAENGATFNNINPATEEVIGVCADATRADMQRAIAAARCAFDETDWSTNREFRKQCLIQLRDAIQSEREELREQLIQEAGCPRMSTVRQQLDACFPEALDYPIELMDRFEWEVELPDGKGSQGEPNARRIWKEAMGVVGAIIPWNFPFEVAINKIAQALATGNTMVLKPAPDTPWSATFIGRMVAEKTDIPPGVLNIVTSSDHMIGEALTMSPAVDVISFTGSTAVGQRIMEKGAATMKRVFLELGGKSANIVLDDANMDSALMGALAVCFHAGQGCGIPTRMLVPKARYEEICAKVKGIMQMAPYGDPQRADVMMGPLVSAKQRDRVLNLIDVGIAEGATLALGGNRPAAFQTGYYVEPTLFTHVDNSMTIAQEEIFGPVLVLIPFEDDDDAVRIANESKYGLVGSVNSTNIERALSVARRIRAGVLSVNGAYAHGADIPFGGYKFSGIGRQNGEAGFNQYLETKSVAWPIPKQ
ncbi:aldehyde dehydrogenase family protein [Ketobacter sp.]|uniref:aldehyde dehydrogenase family protein n=1 Tax=Ketobacter sp. TaxID=2083498 RepID=UPI000F2944F9|nr:aldehyde dehydrogenase family protein [Ketobacter sp.]RLT92805.1 MAG: aldehyde dehydrogenase family protein [Ketobacter sp.]